MMAVNINIIHIFHFNLKVLQYQLLANLDMVRQWTRIQDNDFATNVIFNTILLLSSFSSSFHIFSFLVSRQTLTSFV